MNKHILTLNIAVVFFLFTVFVCQSAEVNETIKYAPPKTYRNLDEPGELEKLSESNPEHYEKIKDIINQIAEKEPTEIEKWLKVDYGVSSVNLSDLKWLTTDPPKKRLDFVLEEASYRLTITIYSHEPKAYKLEDKEQD